MHEVLNTASHVLGVAFVEKVKLLLQLLHLRLALRDTIVLKEQERELPDTMKVLPYHAQQVLMD